MNELALIAAACAAVCLALAVFDDSRDGVSRMLDAGTLALTLIVVGCLILGAV